MSINNVVAFEGWNSSNRAWNTGTWNGDVTFDLTSTGSVGASTVTGDANVTVTGLAGTSAIGNVFETQIGVAGTSAVGTTTITGDASITVTGLAGTSALGSFFTTNESFKMVAVVGSGIIDTTQSCQVFPTGLSATGQIGEGTGEILATWGQILPNQTANFNIITPSQSPSFSAISPSQLPSWTDLAA